MCETLTEYLGNSISRSWNMLDSLMSKAEARWVILGTDWVTEVWVCGGFGGKVRGEGYRSRSSCTQPSGVHLGNFKMSQLQLLTPNLYNGTVHRMREKLTPYIFKVYSYQRLVRLSGKRWNDFPTVRTTKKEVRFAPRLLIQTKYCLLFFLPPW